MPGVSASSQPSNPYLDFKFRLKWNGKYVAAASKCSPLKRGSEATTFRGGGDPGTPQGKPRGGPER
jgi:hypothetical protein